MDGLDRRVRHYLYETLAATARAPSLEAIASRLEIEPKAAQASLARLEAAHALALAPSSGALWMAHPFSAVPTPFRLDTSERSYFGNCAWDVLAIAALVDADGSVDTRCSRSAEPMRLTFERGTLTSRDDDAGVVHLAVPPRRFWENVGYT